MPHRTLRANPVSSLIALTIASLASVSQGCSSAPEPSAGSSGGASPPVTSSAPSSIARVKRPGDPGVPTRTESLIQSSSPLTYYGGRIVSNVQVVAVFWGSGVNSAITSGVGPFFTAATNSAYWDMLAQYDTTGHASPTTNQQLGRGTFAGSYTITPSASGATITDAQIQSELVAQINANNLPKPTADAAGNDNTYYAVFFPSTITQIQGANGAGNSCTSFCAYHGTVSSSTGGSLGEFYYGVHPDLTANQCQNGCVPTGNVGLVFDNTSVIAAHELAETATDCEVGLATVYAPPLAWYNSSVGEIGDICNQQAATITVNSSTYYVQKLYSNADGSCVTSNGSYPAPDFSISSATASIGVIKGQSDSVDITTNATAGSPEPITLTASGVPAGTTVTFSPSSIVSGGTATATVDVGTSTAAGAYTITVTGTASTGTHTTTFQLFAGHGLLNGGFEKGTFSSWTQTASGVTLLGSGCHNGAYCAEVGGKTGTSYVEQKFVVPSGMTELTFWYKTTCPGSVSDEWATAILTDVETGVATHILADTCANDAQWKVVTAPVTAGVEYTLELADHDGSDPAGTNVTLFDSVYLH